MNSVYRFFDASDRLLYVGLAANPFARLVQHGMSDKDMTQVAVIEVEWFVSRSIAMAAERVAISREKPLWNKVGTKKRRKRAKSPKVIQEMNKATDRIALLGDDWRRWTEGDFTPSEREFLRKWNALPEGLDE